ncbi:MAG: hypothetical protein ACT4P9_10585 [Betaproteobacteria bacterium]
MSAGERPISALPAWLRLGFALTLLAQVLVALATGGPSRFASDLPPAPSSALLRAASFGEPAALSRLAMLWLQAFDSGGTNETPFRDLDYGRLTGWLGAVQDTDPRSHYPLFAASRIYAEVPDPVRARQVLEFVYGEYLKAPQLRWPALAHGALLAKHRLKDLPLARRYATAMKAVAQDPSVPLWAKQMEVFILEDMNELEAARIMLGGLLAAGQVSDPGERRFLQGRLEELDRRLAGTPPPVHR